MAPDRGSGVGMARASRRKLFKVDARRKQILTELGQLLCTPEDVALVLGVSQQSVDDSLEAHGKASAAFNAGRAEGVKALRRAQLKLAETSVTMAIFLGKTELGQSERRELDLGDAIDLTEAGRKAEERLAALIAVAPEADADEAGERIQDV